MILGIGFDLVQVDRVERAIERRGERFADRILTDSEKKSASKDLPRYVASRFAAKEALVKALGTGFSKGISLRHIEVISPMKGPPQIKLYDRALEFAQKINVDKIFLSISHEKDVVGAMVVLEGKDK